MTIDEVYGSLRSFVKKRIAVSSISVNGAAQTITNNAVDLDVANNLITEDQYTALQSIFS